MASLAGASISVAAPLANGWLGVDLFFLLSGFVLMLPYADGRRRMESGEDAKAFYRHRWLRLMPLYYFNLFVVWGLVTAPDPRLGRFFQDVFLMLTATFNLSDRLYLPRYNLVLWSLGLEIWFSALFPLLVVAGRRWGIGRLSVAALLLSLGVRMAGVPFGLGGGWNPYLNFVKDSLPGRLDEFVLGMLLAHLYATRRVLGRGKAAAACVLGLLAVYAACLGWDAVILGQLPRRVTPFLSLLVAGGFFSLTLGCVSAHNGISRRLFTGAPLQLLGMMSYSIYIWHAVIRFRMVRPPVAYNPTNVVAYLLITAVVATLSYRYIEFGRERDWRALFRPARG